IPKNDWYGYFRELLDNDYLKRSDGDYPVLKLTEKSHAILKGQEKVMLIKTITRKKAVESTISFEGELLKDLKSIRYELSIKENVPAYIIFSDATLLELAAYLPQNFDELKQISGFGEIKLASYGKMFLEVVVKYCEERELPSKIYLKKPKRQRKKKSYINNGNGKTDTKAETLKLFKSGKTISEIVAARELKSSTIENHLAYYIFDGNVKVGDLVSATKIPHIKQAIRLHGDQALAPIKNELGDEFSYGEIRAVVNYLKVQNKVTTGQAAPIGQTD
ncbi:helix-turn-helix domain-containing protein, partial [bacterium AH-315-M05]|nr:helix-turn-helix domain-containing protein [bacterium AH-315-M05]